MCNRHTREVILKFCLKLDRKSMELMMDTISEYYVSLWLVLSSQGYMKSRYCEQNHKRYHGVIFTNKTWNCSLNGCALITFTKIKWTLCFFCADRSHHYLWHSDV